MQVALYIIIGFLLICAVTIFIVMHGKNKNIQAQLMLAMQQLSQEQTHGRTIQAQLDAASDDNRALSDEMVRIKIDLERANTLIEAEREHTAEERQLRDQQFAEQLKTVQAQFSNLATQILQSTASQLKTNNSESMDAITRPLKQNIEQLQAAIARTNSETAKSTASLSEQLKEMGNQTRKIDETATRLTNVIRGGTKTQGVWGERQLRDILEANGYKLGRDFDIQQTITDEHGNAITNDDSGRRMIPDVILHYPGNEDVVIDSKMSVEAYYQYVNTDDETLKAQYADALVRNIRTQMKNLARKDYSSYIRKPRHAIEFVIMFVPNEGALQLALSHEPRLWGEAFDKQIFLTGQQNLLAILKIIRIAWRQYMQTENQKLVFTLAEELLKRVGEFIKRFETLGKDIQKINADYDEIHKKAYSGRQSIVQKANELKNLGVKESANQPIPQTETDLSALADDYSEAE